MSGDGHQRRSSGWFGGLDKVGLFHRSWMKAEGFPPDLFDGRPIVGICSTWSELTPCNAGMRELAERVKRGVYEAGGLPLEFPVMSLGESNMRPSPMMFRNLASMEVEESIRANPIDGVVLLVGCDKTTPALVMGAASCDLPTIAISAGPMLSGSFRGRSIGSGTEGWRLSEQLRAGQIDQARFLAAEEAMSPSVGTCNTMGTASTMASLIECLGLALPGNAAIPAVDARRMRLAQLTGRRIVEMIRENLVISRLLSREKLRKCHPGECCDWWLNQRRPAPHRDRRPRRCPARPRLLGQFWPRRSNYREPDAIRQVSDAGFLRRRRPGSGHAEAMRSGSAPRRPHQCQWPYNSGKLRPCRML
jgi:L-arabonate dehydrase